MHVCLKRELLAAIQRRRDRPKRVNLRGHSQTNLLFLLLREGRRRLGCILLLPDHEFLDGRRSKQRWVIHGVQLPMLIVGKSLAASGSPMPAHGIRETCPEQVVVLDR